MSGSLLKKIRQQIVLMLIVALLLVAAYVSAGRQFMPAVSQYVSFFEEKVFELSGVLVQAQSLAGDFEGFNPILQVNGMALLVDDAAGVSTQANDTALFLEKASIIVDIPRSIWQRSWVVENFVVEALELNLDQSESGDWQLRGLSSDTASVIDFNNLYRLLQRVSQLSLRNVAVNLRTFEGEVLRFHNGLATIQNSGDSHYLHASLTLQGYSQQIGLSFEVTGNELSAMDGQLYLDIPAADYSELFRLQTITEMNVQQLQGGGNFWFTFEQGQLRDFVAELNLSRFTLLNSAAEPLLLRDFSGRISLCRGEEENSWQLALSDMALSWQQLQWSPFNVYADLQFEQSLQVRADNIDVSLIAQLAESSGLLSAAVQQQLEAYAPRGKLENFSLMLPLATDSKEHFLLKTNLLSVDVASVLGSPNMWGISGYAEVDYDLTRRRASGLVEVESEEFRMNIPNVFTSIWEHNYVNGSVGVSFDASEGMNLKLVSNVIVSETAMVDGRVQFTSTINRPDNGEPKAELELLIGVYRFDAEAKSSYLPDGTHVKPELANIMQWLDGAILDGVVANSGALYRGSTLPNAIAASKTFQSFYLMNDGELNFSDAWPNLSDVTAYVTTDDNNVDIDVHSSNSLNVNASAVVGSIRRNARGEDWLTLKGQTSGATADGLNYLHKAAVSENLKSAFENWQVEGNFNADIVVEVPLSKSQQQTEVRIAMALEDNSLFIPDYALQLEEVTGPVIFDTRTGLEASVLSGQLFEQAANIKLSSNFTQGRFDEILLETTGLVAPKQLIAWPMQSQFVKNMLGRMEGKFAYQANLSIDQAVASEAVHRLTINSTLLGASLSLPHPFTKPVEVELPLNIELEFTAQRQQITGTFGPTLSFDLDIEQGAVRDGLVLVGDAPSNFENLLENKSQGLTVLGSIDRFQLEQWSDFLAEFNSKASVSEGMSGAIDSVDIQIESFEFHGQQLSDVNMKVVPQLPAQVWQIGLQGDSIAGQVKLPFDSEDYLSLDLEYLRLPGEEADRMGPQMEANPEQTLPTEQEAVDVLADIDPRQLPRMHFSTDEFRLGDRPYGNWSFTLNPNTDGAEIDNLAFDFRGLRLGLDTAVDDATDEASDELIAEADTSGSSKQLIPHFSWHYDGVEHNSTLSGVLSADNMADVLMANGYAASFESRAAEFVVDVSWPGSPAFFAAASLSGEIAIDIEDGRFLQGSGSIGALKLISILNFDAIMRRLQFSDSLLRSGLAYDEIIGRLILEDGQVNIEDRLVISGPSSLYQFTGDLNLKDETIVGEMYITLPLSQNIPWIGLLTANLPLAVGAYLFDKIFGNQVNNLTSAVYTLEGPWQGLKPEFKQAFAAPDSRP